MTALCNILPVKIITSNKQTSLCKESVSSHHCHMKLLVYDLMECALNTAGNFLFRHYEENSLGTHYPVTAQPLTPQPSGPGHQH